jgi:FKBP-type peptidyl-prolyl cis-trans isomerase
MQKKILVPGLMAATVLLTACGPKDSGAATTLTTDQQQFGYAIGVQIGKQLQSVKDNVDLPSVKAGIDDVVNGKTLRMDDAARTTIGTKMSTKIQQEHMAAMQKAGKEAQEAGAKFLAENGKKTGVKTTASGLQYEVLKEGTGEHPKATDMVTVNYRGTLINGKEFDSSYSRNQPTTFPLNGVIPGWTEGLQLMTVGAKYKFYVPSQLAYGEQGGGATIGPNETLIFEVELLSIGAPTH